MLVTNKVRIHGVQGSVPTELLAMALVLVGIAKNGYSTHFLASLTLTILLRAQCERILTGILPCSTVDGLENL